MPASWTILSETSRPRGRSITSARSGLSAGAGARWPGRRIEARRRTGSLYEDDLRRKRHDEGCHAALRAGTAHRRVGRVKRAAGVGRVKGDRGELRDGWRAATAAAGRPGRV